MLKRSVALSFLQNVLWSMMRATQTADGHTKDQCHGIILDIEPLLKTDKIQAIMDLRDWVNDKQSILLPTNLGAVIRNAMKDQGYTYCYDAKEVTIMADKRFSLKEANDFADLMEVVLKNTEAKSF